MAISDLLWACPECGEDRGLESRGHDAVCRACGARYARDRGALIRRTGRDGSEALRTPADWVGRLPALDAVRNAASGGVIRTARVAARQVVEEAVIREHGRYLNRVERFGAETGGTLRLLDDRLEYREPGASSPRTWTFDEMTAVQASSKTLQIKARDRPLVSFRFADDSIFLWEQLVTDSLRRFYEANAKGRIVEFQPRIVTG